VVVVVVVVVVKVRVMASLSSHEVKSLMAYR